MARGGKSVVVKGSVGLRVAVGVLGGLGLGAAGVLLLPPLVVPGGPDIEERASELPPLGEAVVALPPGSSEPASDTPESTAPGFDTVRLEPDGSGLVAGRAKPGAAIEILADDEIVAEAEADADGRFVAFLSLAPSGTPRALALRDGAGQVSEETVILAPLAAPEQLAPADDPDVVAAGPALDSLEPGADEVRAAVLADTSPPPGGRQVGAIDPGPALRGPADASEQTSSADPDPAVAPDPGPALASNDRPSPPTSLADSRPALAEPPSTLSNDQGIPTAAPSGEPAPPAPEAGPAATTSAVLADPTPPGSTNSEPRSATPPEVAAAAPGLPVPDTPASPGQAPVLVSDADGVRVLQPALPAGADPEILSTVALDAITYGGAGEVVLSGRGSGGTVRLYLDNRPVGEVAIGEDGRWSAELAEAEAGVYTLRLDQLGPEGEVVSRIETPFQREERSSLAAVMAEAQEAGQTIAMRTVQPGNTLWAIARDRYGEPLMYVRVFEANRDRIRNPDLIYPGQVFVLPATDGR